MAFLVGAQKSGTTTLTALLKQHPDLEVCVPEEPQYFSVNFDRGVDWYRSLYARDDVEMWLDGSTSYAMLPAAWDATWDVDTVRRVHEYAPEARFIYVLRDPVDRAYSAYWHERRQGRESRELEQAIRERRSYVGAGLYSERLAVWLECFSLDRFHLVDFKDLVKEPLQVAEQCLNFLGLDAERVQLEDPGRRNQSFQYSRSGNMLRSFLGTNDRLEGVARFVSRWAPEWSHRWLKGSITRGIPPLSDADRQLLTPHFDGERERLEKLSGFRGSW
jgi:hypothetical protein